MQTDSFYYVTNSEQCKVVRGNISLRDLSALMLSWSSDERDWVACALITDRIGAVLVAGPREAIMRWRKKLNVEV